MINVDVIIIGAGQAGMAAAHRLMEGGQDNIHVIEAHSHVGGRTRNFDCKTCNYDTATDNAIELGGTWISPDHEEFLKLCRHLDIQVFRASFLETNNEAPMSAEEWPWWYWGPEYREEEMQMAKKTIFHHKQGQEHAKFSFRGPSELISQLNSDTVAELETVGNND